MSAAPPASTRVGAAADTKTAKGRFASVPVGGAACLSAVGICTQGVLNGAFKATFFFTATSLTSGPDTPLTGVAFYTGDSQMSTPGGELTCKDAGGFRTVAEGAVASVCTITGGTGDCAGATGTIQFVGTFSGATGGEGEYRARIAVP